MPLPLFVPSGHAHWATVLLVAWASQTPLLLLGGAGSGETLTAPLAALTLGAVVCALLLQPALREAGLAATGALAGEGVALGGIALVFGCLALLMSGSAANQAVSFGFLSVIFDALLLAALLFLTAYLVGRRATKTGGLAYCSDVNADVETFGTSAASAKNQPVAPKVIGNATRTTVGLLCLMGIIASFMMAFAARPLVPLGAPATGLLTLEGALAALGGAALALFSTKKQGVSGSALLSLTALLAVIGIVLGCALVCAKDSLPLIGLSALDAAGALVWTAPPLLTALSSRRRWAAALTLASGMGWASALGCWARQILGLDVAVFAAVALVAVGLTTVLLSLASLRRRPSVESSSTHHAEAPTDTSPEKLESPSAQDAARVIVITRESILTSFGLSPRETQVALHMLDGLTAAEAADQMGISTSTVKFHLSNVYKKADVQSKFELVRRVRDAMESEGDAADE